MSCAIVVGLSGCAEFNYMHHERSLSNLDGSTTFHRSWGKDLETVKVSGPNGTWETTRSSEYDEATLHHVSQPRPQYVETVEVFSTVPTGTWGGRRGRFSSGGRGSGPGIPPSGIYR